MTRTRDEILASERHRCYTDNEWRAGDVVHCPIQCRRVLSSAHSPNNKEGTHA